ncbi:MAG: DHH family phosphoesterase [Acidobacteriota bacterium]
MELEERLIRRLVECRNIVICTHMSSDGDGIGSELALGRGLAGLGHTVHMINPTPVPQSLTFLLKYPDEIRTIDSLDAPHKLFAEALTVVVDMGAFERLGDVLPYARSSRGILVIDHHRLKREPGADYMLDTEASATGEVVARILEHLGIPLALDLAEPIYAALYTDTGGFRYSGTTGATHRMAGTLLDAGVDPQKIHTEIFERQSKRRLRVLGRVLQSLEGSPGGKIVWMQATQRDLQALGATMDDADDLVNYTMQVDGVQAGFYFKELSGEATKVSCRSRGNFAVDQFASRWGGGGHAHAAGIRIALPLDRAKDEIISAAVSVLEKRP